MDGTTKLGLMTTATIAALWALAWVVAELITYLSKDDK